MRKTLVSEMTWEEVRQHVEKDAVVVLPVGATEQHGKHLPLNVDYYHCEKAVHHAANKVDNVVVLPTLKYGVSNHHMEYSGTMSLSVQTFLLVVNDLLVSIAKHGFNKVVIINGHGGNRGPLSSAIAMFMEKNIRHPMIALANYYSFGSTGVDQIRESGIGGMAHAGEHETSLSLYLQKELVQMDKAVTRIPQSPIPKYIHADLMGDSAVGFAVSYDQENKKAWEYSFCDSGVAGDPTLATAEKGEQLFKLIVDDMVAFLTEFAALN